MIVHGESVCYNKKMMIRRQQDGGMTMDDFLLLLYGLFLHKDVCGESRFDGSHVRVDAPQFMYHEVEQISRVGKNFFCSRIDISLFCNF